MLWGLRDRRLLVIGGLVAAILGGTLISMIFRPSILHDYINFLQTAPVTNWRVPTAGFWLRAIWGQDLVIYQFAPLVFGLIWLLIYYWRRRAEWHWLHQISWISLVSLTTTPFAWSHDQVILIPALIEAVVLYNKHIRTTSTKILMLTAWIILNVLLFLTHLSHDDSWFVWQTPLFLLFYAAVKIFIRPVQADKPEKANWPSPRFLYAALGVYLGSLILTLVAYFLKIALLVLIPVVLVILYLQQIRHKLGATA